MGLLWISSQVEYKELPPGVQSAAFQNISVDREAKKQR
jgi:hypothetical protein